LDGGLGSVLSWQKNIPLQGADSAMEVITAVASADQDGFWVFVRSFSATNKLLAYLVDASGVHQAPVVSSCLRNQSFLQQAGTVKASSDGRYMVFGPSAWSLNLPVTELYKLNNATGEVSPVVLFNSGGINWGAEFSANSEYLYIAGEEAQSSTSVINQYDMSKTASATTFQNSKTLINALQGAPKYWQCQMAPDGKIYISQFSFSPSFSKYLSVIKEPSKKGSLCNFQANTVVLVSGTCMMGLPTFVQSYFVRFTWTGECKNSGTQFTSNFNPVPDSIYWNFGDLSSGVLNFSKEFNPVHIFSDSGSFNVKAKAFNANGHQEEAMRIVKISAQPDVSLGPDRFVCPNTMVTIDAGSGFTKYQWSTGQVTQTIQVADTGMFWVDVFNNKACRGSDSIHIACFPAPQVDESALVISPTTCGGSTGAIAGLSVTGNPPLSYEWKNGDSLLVSTNLDLVQLPVDNYTLYVTDGYGCTRPSHNFTINDVSDLLIDTVLVQQSHCGKADGEINVIAITGLSAMLKYSIDNGKTYSNLGKFTYLPHGTYKVKVMVSDTTQPCQKVYDFNPVIILNLAGPKVSHVATHFETGSLSDGSIVINASGSGDTLIYSIGTTPQINNGNFYNLPSGTYTCSVTDKNGCDTTFLAVVNNLMVNRLEAIAGGGSACLGNIAVLPLLTNQFNKVNSFQVRLHYDKSLVTCQNYLNPNPLLADSLQIDLFPAIGELVIKWTGKKTVSLDNGSTLLELSFASVVSGQSPLSWDISPGVCVFHDSLGGILPSEFFKGEVRVYSVPEADISGPLSACEGGEVILTSDYHTGTGNGAITYKWSGPDGFSGTTPIVSINPLSQATAGQYTLILSDTNHCKSKYTAQVNVLPTPVSEFPTASDTLYFDERLELIAGETADQYLWNTGDTTNSILVTAEGWYKVTITTAGGCQTIDSVMMLYAFSPFTMPNAFSPDGDGFNEVFRPVTLPEKISSYNMYIYDRWGQQVFFTNDVTQGWDGNINGSPAQIGGYVYYLKYGNTSGAVREKRGMVTVVR